MPTPRRARRVWLAISLIAIALGPALHDALSGFAPVRGCRCAGGACCARSGCPACAAGGCRCHQDAAAREAARSDGSRRFTTSCTCSHPAPLGAASGNEIPALVVALATVPPPVAHAAAPSLWRGPAGAHVRTPLTPPPRPLLPAA
ncbi:MAG TPA: hypothetical protein PKO05_02820 [Thermoanaerobaculia bacterium]|jgi:hypothetical protein|nr:hypothetical protein [Thermoanaerobaculia bacterium]